MLDASAGVETEFVSASVYCVRNKVVSRAAPMLLTGSQRMTLISEP